MWVYMEYYQHKANGLYYVIRYRDTMELSTTPFCFKTESTAINYIIAHGLTPHKIDNK